MKCPRGHPMSVEATFRLDHEPGDSPRTTALIEALQARGVELGAAVSTHYCGECDLLLGAFDYPSAFPPEPTR
jgi:hypothetical protein